MPESLESIIYSTVQKAVADVIARMPVQPPPESKLPDWDKPDPDIFTQESLAKYLHCGQPVIAMLRDEGLLDFVKVNNRYLYKKEDVEKFLGRFKNQDLSTPQKIRIAKQVAIKIAEKRRKA